MGLGFGDSIMFLFCPFLFLLEALLEPMCLRERGFRAGYKLFAMPRRGGEYIIS